jgi:hypothetical protein
MDEACLNTDTLGILWQLVMEVKVDGTVSGS